MKILAISLVSLAMIASPVLAQQDNTMATSTTTTKVKTTTRHIHATNVPRHATHHASRHHHMMRCGCPSTHMSMHRGKTHHVVKKTTETTTTKS